MTRAAIDVGSNSILLVVEREGPEGWQTLLETSEVTGLGDGAKTTGLLSERGMRDTLAAVARAYENARRYEAEEVRAAGTMAVRIARNADEFLCRAREQGTPIVPLSGEAEAELGFRAVANDPLFKGIDRLSIVDPGGHSTELQTAERVEGGWKVLFRRSYPVGGLALREGHLEPQTPGAEARLRASAAIDDLLGFRYRSGEAGTLVALGAIGTNLVSMREGLAAWQPGKVHGAALRFDEVSEAFARMSDLDDAGRRALVGLEPGRERTIHTGSLILERVMHAVCVASCVVSVRGWRHALLEEGFPAGHPLT